MRIIVDKLPEKPEDCLFCVQCKNLQSIYDNPNYCMISQKSCNSTEDCNNLMRVFPEGGK